ncbi:hypothetical protein TNCV_2552831 [Trichonephila clavipes]|nr:hypothetical protein TNCV_2552831 [Trichonephila clavipes]
MKYRVFCRATIEVENSLRQLFRNETAAFKARRVSPPTRSRPFGKFVVGGASDKRCVARKICASESNSASNGRSSLRGVA